MCRNWNHATFVTATLNLSVTHAGIWQVELLRSLTFTSELQIYGRLHTSKWATRWHSWLRHCAINRNVAGSIPDLQSFRPHYDPGIDSASNRNEYQEYFLGDKGGRCVGLTTLPLSCADCLEIWEPQPLGTLCACNRPVMGLLYLYIQGHYFV